MSFNPQDHLRSLKGQDYLDCKWRVVWFRDKHPDGQIDTEIVHMDRESREVVFKATVTVPSTGARASGYCEGDHSSFKHGYIEKAETQAIGRALALLGFGTQFSNELDTDEDDKLADSPIPQSESKKAQDSKEARADLATEIITKIGYRPNFGQWAELAKTHNAEVPVSPDSLTVAILQHIRNGLNS